MEKLQVLDQTCSPPILPHISVDTLSDQELRDALIAPSRHYDRCLKGEARYGKQQSIVLPPLYHSTTYDVTPFCTELLKLAPGGRYLLVGSVEMIHVIDTREGGRCIWSRTAGSISENDPQRRMMDIATAAIDVCSDGSLTLLLLYSSNFGRDDLYVCFPSFAHAFPYLVLCSQPHRCLPHRSNCKFRKAGNNTRIHRQQPQQARRRTVHHRGLHRLARSRSHHYHQLEEKSDS